MPVDQFEVKGDNRNIVDNQAENQKHTEKTIEQLKADGMQGGQII